MFASVIPSEARVLATTSFILSEARDLGSTLRSLVVPPRDDNPE